MRRRPAVKGFLLPAFCFFPRFFPALFFFPLCLPVQGGLLLLGLHAVSARGCFSGGPAVYGNDPAQRQAVAGVASQHPPTGRRFPADKLHVAAAGGDAPPASVTDDRERLLLCRPRVQDQHCPQDIALKRLKPSGRLHDQPGQLMGRPVFVRRVCAFRLETGDFRSLAVSGVLQAVFNFRRAWQHSVLRYFACCYHPW